MTEITSISPLTTLVTFIFAALIVGGMALYLAVASREKK